MKTLILFLLLFSVSIFGQSSRFYKLGILFDGGYKNPETTLYLAGQTVSGTQATRIDNFITMLKDSLSITSLSFRFDVMYLFANENATLGLRNLVKRSHDASLSVTPPTFTAFEGFQGNGSSAYVNTNYIPSTNSVKFIQDSASLGIYSRTDTDEVKEDVSSSSTAGKNISLDIRISNVIYYAINDQTSSSGANTSSLGLFTITRTGTFTKAVYRNGILLASASIASSALNNDNIIIGGRNVNGTITLLTTKEYSFFFIGDGLSITDVRKIYNCIQTYMTGIGKQV